MRENDAYMQRRRLAVSARGVEPDGSRQLRPVLAWGVAERRAEPGHTRGLSRNRPSRSPRGKSQKKKESQRGCVLYIIVIVGHFRWVTGERPRSASPTPRVPPPNLPMHPISYNSFRALPASPVRISRWLGLIFFSLQGIRYDPRGADHVQRRMPRPDGTPG